VFYATCVFLTEGQRAQGFGEQREPRHTQRDLPRARLHESTFDAQVVTEIEQLQQAIRLGTELVRFEVELNLPTLVFEMRKCRLAMRSERHQPAGEHMPRGIVVALVGRLRLLRRRGALEAVGKRRNAARDQRVQLVAPRRFDEAALTPRRHYAALFPKRFKNASINGSRSPSMTLWTSLTFSSVR